MESKLDMSMMFAMHDALRRELVQVARTASLRDDHPGRLLEATLGWELFKKFLTVHHRSEDDALWPPLRAHVADKPRRPNRESSGHVELSCRTHLTSGNGRRHRRRKHYAAALAPTSHACPTRDRRSSQRTAAARWLASPWRAAQNDGSGATLPDAPQAALPEKIGGAARSALVGPSHRA
jgi:hypothetical protein